MLQLPAPLERIVPAFVNDLRAGLGDDFVGAYLYGSAVSGGFHAEFSDLDVVVVTERSTAEIDFDRFDGIVRGLAAREPDWADRLDITFVGRDTLATFRSGGPLVDNSHESPLQRLSNADDWLLTWFLVREADTALVGPSPRTLIPPIAFDEFIGGAAADVDGLMERALGEAPDAADAYRLLTLSRILRSLETGAICSKEEGADWVARSLPETADAIAAAQRVRMSRGSRSFTSPERAEVGSSLRLLAEQIRSRT